MEFTMPVVPIDSSETLVRLTFNPESYDSNGFKNTAVSLQDLKERGFSLDREAYTHRECIEERIAAQKENKPEDRQFAIFSMMNCIDITSIVNEDGSACFDLIPSPDLDTKNFGHAHLLSAGAVKSDSYLRKMRVLLFPLLSKCIKHNLDDFSFPLRSDG